ncbi:MAG: S46 family peptidase [Planctomycetes bacterium]|nr:S46 family peptidase [Planctomycetota bacterium]
MSRPAIVRLLALFAFCLALVLGRGLGNADEGQWPLSMLGKLDLKKAGMTMDPAEIFDPGKPSLVDAICRVGGATGSFVSPQGLIVTNHHVAFDAVSQVSTPERDYLHDGFVAATLADELVAPGYVCHITVGYRDVSAEVLSVVTEAMSPADRLAAVARKRAEITAQAQADDPGLRPEVAEMFQGRNYVLFLYQEIKDVRLVCVPPRAVGEYGGENDNWIWPRHTGDFAFLRAYVAPDGSPAPYAADNVPFQPKRFLKVNPEGLHEGDFVFLLGYPGRTYRHQCASYVQHEEELRMPYIADYFEARIRRMEKVSENDAALALELAPDIKGLANTMKNFRGKILGLHRLKLVAKKRHEEEELSAWIAADDSRRALYGGVLDELDSIYAAYREPQLLEFALWRLRQGSRELWGFVERCAALRGLAGRPVEDRPTQLAPAAMKKAAADLDDFLAKRPLELVRDDLVDSLAALFDLPEGVRPAGLAEIMAANRDAAETPSQVIARSLLDASGLLDAEGRLALAEGRAENDDVLDVADLVSAVLPGVGQASRERRGRLDQLMSLYVDAKQAWRGGDFVPDANSTFRLTYGHIRRYSPRDAVVYLPFTTLGGMLAKATGAEPFDPPAALADLRARRDFGRWLDPQLDDVPLAMLYDCDTTGGNSGSPVMNGKGELVGVNFDRAYEATINDFQWSEDYSRSIGVDVRYVLFIIEKLMGAERVVAELLD